MFFLFYLLSSVSWLMLLGAVMAYFLMGVRVLRAFQTSYDTTHLLLLVFIISEIALCFNGVPSDDPFGILR